MIKSYYKVYKVYPDPDYVWLKNEGTEVANFITGSKMKSPINLEYSLDKTRWNNYDMSNKPTISVPAGDYIYLRGVNSSVTFSDTLSLVFSLNQKFSTGGDIRTLLNHQDVNSVTKIPDHAFRYCFDNNNDNNNNNNITSCTWDMSGITEVGWHGFLACFVNCTSLTTPPDFSNLTSVDSGGFYNCFYGCRSLTTGPDFSKVTSVGSSGFETCFAGCTSLTTPPNFSNLTSVGSGGFDNCFYSCKSLTTAPNFSKVTSVGSSGFDACFAGCTSLNLVTTPKVTTWNTNSFYYWLYKVASSGVVRKPANLTIPTGSDSGVPAGWTTENY